MGGKSKSSTVGYRYAFSIHMGFGRGPVNVLKHVKVGDLTAWEGRVTDNMDIQIDKPNLFGGDEKEGGIVGTLSVFMGHAAQTFSSVFKSLLGGLVPDFRGITTFFWRGQISVNNPYPKAWSFRAARWSAGWDIDETDPLRSAVWYEPKARILMADGTIDAMNPAHILYQCLTDRSWGRGLSPVWIHEESFVSAANVLCAEMFGLCLKWNRQSDIGEFMDSVLSHIGGVFFDDPETGQVGVRLIRGDYDPETLPVFTMTSGLLSIAEDEVGGADNAFNEVVVVGTDPVNGKDFSIREQSPGLMQAMGEIVSTTAAYPGLPTADLAMRVARRDLDLQAANRRFTLEMDRRGWRIVPGSVFKISVPSRGIDNLILRASTTEDDELTSGKIIIKAVVDMFGLPSAGYSTPETGEWAPPDNTAYPPSVVRVEEATYRDLVRNLSPGDLAMVTDDVGAIAVLAIQPTPTAISYDLATAATGEQMQIRGRGDWTAAAPLAEPVGHYDTVLVFDGAADLSPLVVGEAILVNDEIMRVDGIDNEAKTVTVGRGCVDTVPAAHDADSLVWFFEDMTGLDSRDYAEGEDVEVRVLTITPTDRLTIEDAPGVTSTIAIRQARPYPPGDVRVEGDPCFGPLANAYPGEIEFTWSERDRKLQEDQLVEHEAGTVGPEAGVTYTLRIYDDTTLVRTASGITGGAWIYDSSMLGSDGEPVDVGWWIELEAERDGLNSHQMYHFFVPRRAPVSVFGQTGSVLVTGVAGTSSPRAVRVLGVAGSLNVES